MVTKVLIDVSTAISSTGFKSNHFNLVSKRSTIEVDSQEGQFDYNQGADFVLLKLAPTSADLP